jgi:hypothetical protein
MPAPAMPSSASIQPLSPLTFVFERFFRRGEDAWVSHIYAYDLQSGEQRLITTLDEDVGRGNLISGMSVSPDRRWIVFASRAFRLTLGDAAARTNSIWAVSVDGTRFVRLTPTFPPAMGSGRSCSTNDQCGREETCSGGRCGLSAFQRKLSDPAWSADGMTVYFSMSQSMVAEGELQGGVTIGAVKQMDISLAGDISCQLVGSPGVSPDGSLVLSSTANCLDDFEDGLYTWDPALKRPRLVAHSTSHFVSPLLVFMDEPPVWLPENAGALLIPAVGYRSAGGPLNFRYGLAAWNAKTGEVKKFYSPPDDSHQIRGATVVPVGGTRVRVVAAVESYDPPATDLYEFDADANKKPLTTSGNNTTPRW